MDLDLRNIAGAPQKSCTAEAADFPRLAAPPGAALTRELELARKASGLFPGGASQFKKHFGALIEKLRDGVPYSERDAGNFLTPGMLLKLYLLSFVQDQGRIEALLGGAGKGTLGLMESARCLTDETRTKKFLSAVRDAVSRMAAADSGPIKVIDAGCGSVPVQALQAAIANPRVSVTALELNPASAEMARQIVKALELEQRITVIEADAREYRPAEKQHLVISETLQAGLAGEPVVQILSNLAPRLCRGGVMIPEAAEIRCGLIPLSQIKNPQRTVDTAIEQVPVTAPLWQDMIVHQFGHPLPRITFDFTPAAAFREMSLVCVEIELKLGNEVLRRNESQITMPRKVLDENLAPLLVSGDEAKVLVSYVPGEKPFGFVR